MTFVAGETSKTITVMVQGDTAYEPDETLTMTLSGASGAVIGTGTATGTITNDDPNYCVFDTSAFDNCIIQ